MNQLETVVRGGVVVDDCLGAKQADIGINGGRIAALATAGTLDGHAESVIDAEGLVILPGVVDPHVHLGSGGGMAEYEGDSAAGAIGGVTTALYILMDDAPYLDVVPRHVDVASRDCALDYSFHPTLFHVDHRREVPELERRWGITSFKYYMSFRGSEGSYLGIPGTDDGELYDVLSVVAAVGGVLLVHAENIEIVWTLRRALIGAGRDDLLAWEESRPPVTEAEAIGRVARLAATQGTRLYVVHVSSEEGLAEVRRARSGFPNLELIAETCPHYLTHTTEGVHGPLGKVNPPLRSGSDRDALWGGLAAGDIDTIGSDHVSRRVEAKEGSIWTAGPGFPGMPTLLPVLLTEGHLARGLPLARIADLTAATPARLFGLAGRKGRIAVGYDADLAIVDLDWERVPRSADLGTWADYSLYEDRALRGWPRYTVVRGRIVQHDGEILGSRGGQYLSRSQDVVEGPAT